MCCYRQLIFLWGRGGGEASTSGLSLLADLEMEEDLDIRLYLSGDEEEEEEEEDEEIYFTEHVNDDSSTMIVKLPPAEVRKTLFEETEKKYGEETEGEGDIVEQPIVTTPENVLHDMVAAIGQCKECGGELKLDKKTDVFDSDIAVKCEFCDITLFERKAEKTKVKSSSKNTKITASVI